MSLPGLAKLAKVKRSASVPKAGIPLGNSLVVFLIMDSSCFGFIKPDVLFVNKLSNEIPSMRSIGSNTFPFDLLIFCPSASRIKP